MIELLELCCEIWKVNNILKRWFFDLWATLKVFEKNWLGFLIQFQGLG